MSKTRNYIILRPNQYNDGDLRLALFTEDYQKYVQGKRIYALYINLGTSDYQIDSLITYFNHGSIVRKSIISTWLQQNGFRDETDMLLFEVEIDSDRRIHKYRFICRTRKRFNKKEWFLVRMALDASISASVSRNPFYVNRNESDRIHRKWKELLLKYSYDTPVDAYVEIVNQLKMELKDFAGDSATVRLSHAQKSLSVFLKYLWCYGLVQLPPACPIDRTILDIARQRNHEIATRRWTLLDDIKEYRRIINALNVWAGKVSLAEKELEYWNNI